MKTYTINIETKKGVIALTRWGVEQVGEYPRIGSGCGRLQWENGGPLFGQCGQEPKGLGRNYRAVLLAEGVTELGEGWNRCQLAGYCEGPGKQANGGAFSLRGRDLGEVSAEIDGAGNVSFKVRGFDRPTDGEREFLKQQVAPYLVAHIEQDRAELYRDAARRIVERFAGCVAEARAKLDELELEAAEVTRRLWADGPGK